MKAAFVEGCEKNKLGACTADHKDKCPKGDANAVKCSGDNVGVSSLDFIPSHHIRTN